HRGDLEEDSKAWRRMGSAIQLTVASKPAEHVIEVGQGVAAQGQEDVVALDDDWDVECELGDTRIGGRDVGGAGASHRSAQLCRHDHTDWPEATLEQI